MFNSKTLSFLNGIGLTEISIKIYRYLLIKKDGSINEIKKELNYSYSQVQRNLSILEKKGLVSVSETTKPKLYYRINPKLALNELLNKKFEKLRKNIQKIDEEIKINESESGVCLKNISFYYYSNINLAIENFYQLIENAEKEILMSSLPPIFLKKIEPALFEAVKRGVGITIYFSLLDFKDITNYLEIITEILKRIKITLVETEEKTCRNVRFNDDIVNEGLFLVDNIRLNSISFMDNKMFLFNGFFAPMVVKQSKHMLEIKTVLKRMELEYPKSIQNILDLIGNSILIKTRDISKKSKTGGGKLREILEFLKEQRIIEEITIKSEMGRPGIYYRLTE